MFRSWYTIVSMCTTYCTPWMFSCSNCCWWNWYLSSLLSFTTNTSAHIFGNVELIVWSNSLAWHLGQLFVFCSLAVLSWETESLHPWSFSWMKCMHHWWGMLEKGWNIIPMLYQVLQVSTNIWTSPINKKIIALPYYLLSIEMVISNLTKYRLSNWSRSRIKSN